MKLVPNKGFQWIHLVWFQFFPDFDLFHGDALFICFYMVVFVFDSSLSVIFNLTDLLPFILSRHYFEFVRSSVSYTILHSVFDISGDFPATSLICWEGHIFAKWFAFPQFLRDFFHFQNIFSIDIPQYFCHICYITFPLFFFFLFEVFYLTPCLLVF